MHEAANSPWCREFEWKLKPSSKQVFIDLLFLTGCAGMAAHYSQPFELPVFILLESIAGLGCFVMAVQGRLVGGIQGIRSVGQDNLGWWIESRAGTQRVQWHRLMVRRSGFILLRWRRLPWNGIIIRPDNLDSEQAFRSLSARLACDYGIER
ncbi:MAG: hypothetical protein ACPGYX_09780 [Oceanobacter sp.]